MLFTIKREYYLKKVISFLIASVLLAIATITVGAADVAEYEFGEIAHLSIGDVNADTEVSSTDLVVLRKKLLSFDIFISSAADMNYDGAVDIIDLVRLKKKIVGVEPISIFEDQANDLKNNILNSDNTIPDTVKGTIYYVSKDGSNLANGSEEKPYSYAQFINEEFSLNSVDAVLFKRGEVFRNGFVAKSGVYYGAYGKGDKPCIYGSKMNYANANWSYTEANIWVCDITFSKDVGTVIFNNGEFIGYKKPEKSGLKNNGDFWCDKEDNYKLYMCMEKNPTEVYKSIEIGTYQDIIAIYSGAENITIENLCLKYTGAHGIGISTNCNNIAVRNCEISFIGGCYLSGTLRFGNGIQLWQACKDIIIENNWIHDIYDSGVTHQGSGEYIAKNITVKANLIERCGMGSIEYWLGFTDSDRDGVYEGRSKCVNVNYIENIMRYAGYGYGGEQRPDKISSHIRSDVSCPNWSQVFNVRNNIFDISTGDLFEIGGTWGPYPTLSGNIYAQFQDRNLGVYGKYDINDFGLFIKDTINYDFGDTNAKVYYY